MRCRYNILAYLANNADAALARRRIPLLHLLETTSAFATLALLQANPSFVAPASVEVAQFFAHQQMS
jgi:hypothetical protein